MRFVRSGSQSPSPFPSPLIFLEEGSRVGRRTGGLLLIALGVLAVSLTSSSAASAQTLKTLVSFNGVDTGNPHAGLIADAHGNLFGTTSSALGSDGTVFEIAKTTSGYAATLTTLATFDGSNGAWSAASLIVDANGNLFGTTVFGGNAQAGTVFGVLKDRKGSSHSSARYCRVPACTLVLLSLLERPQHRS